MVGADDIPLRAMDVRMSAYGLGNCAAGDFQKLATKGFPGTQVGGICNKLDNTLIYKFSQVPTTTPLHP